MNEIKDIAKETSISGVGRRRDLRRMSKSYLALHDKVKELEEIINKLKGGESVERRISYRESRIFINSDCCNRLVASVHPEYDAINRLFGFGLVSVEEAGFEWYIIKGPEQHVKSFLFLTKAISKLIQDAYNSGFEDGKKMLILLASEKITLKELDNKALKNE